MKRLAISFILFSAGTLFAQTEPVAVAVAEMQAGNLASAETTLRTELERQPSNPAALDVLAIVLDQQKKYAEAERIYGRAVTISPRDPSLVNNYANHLVATGHLDEAKKMFSKVVALEPGNRNANVQLASIALTKKNGAEALLDLGRLRKADRENPETAMLYGKAFATVGRYGEAEKCFRQVIEAKPEDFDALYDLGLAASKLGHVQQAHDVLAKALNQQPRDVDVLYDLAVVNIQLGDKLQALQLLARGAEAAPGRADVLQLLAHCSADLGYFEDAIQAWDRYLGQVPGDDSARRERAFAETAIGKNGDSGLADLEAFVANHPTDPAGHYELGTALSASQPERAIKELDRATSLKPNFAGAQVARGLLRYRQGDLTRAVSDFEAAAREDPKNPRILDRLGETYLASDKPAEALPLLQHASELAPDDASVLLHLGRALTRSGKSQEASTIFARYRQLDQKSNAVPHESGLVEFLGLPQSEQLARYRAGVERTVESEPTNLEAQVRFLELLLQDGKFGEASGICQHIVTLHPQPVMAAEAANALLDAEQYSVAEEFISKVIAAGSSSPELQLDLAVATFHAVSAQAGLDAMNRIEQTARPANFYLARTQMLQSLGRFGESSSH